jgi:hypothetical protein
MVVNFLFTEDFSCTIYRYDYDLSPHWFIAVKLTAKEMLSWSPCYCAVYNVDNLDNIFQISVTANRPMPKK